MMATASDAETVAQQRYARTWFVALEVVIKHAACDWPLHSVQVASQDRGAALKV